MKIEYYDLNNYLYHFGIKEESICEYKEDNETIVYFLFRYEIFAKQREKLIKEVEIEEMRVEELLENSKHIKYMLRRRL